ncbi:MAG: DUF1080 domain-containing protein [Planctomycetes bacterium]|nr:DUF1080 domain-containing protein [Planctomycetota bacterium]
MRRPFPGHLAIVPIVPVAAVLAFLALSARAAAYEQPPVEPGFELLFDGKDIARHFTVKGDPASWKVSGGVILSTPGGDRIASKERYGDFVLRLEWRVSPGGNSGVFIRVPSPEDGAPWVTGFEAQISNEQPPRDLAHCTGSLYGVEAVSPRPDESPGVWHRYEIRCLGKRITVSVDGVQCVDADSEKNAEMQKRPLEGHVGLQDSHAGPGSTIEYRNVRIQRLGPDGTIQGFTPLSRDSKGWRTIRTGHGTGGRWVLEDGAWVGEQDPPGSGNGGVNATEALYGDFELVLEAKPDWGCDSGVFLRSTSEGRCYQVLVDYYQGGNVGGIYGEGTGGFNHRSYSFTAEKGIAPAALRSDVLPCPFDPSEWGKRWKHDGYNEVCARVRSDPPVIEVWLDGAYLTRFEDREKRIPEKGRLGLQVHGGKGWPAGAKVRYRGIQVRELAR